MSLIFNKWMFFYLTNFNNKRQVFVILNKIVAQLYQHAHNDAFFVVENDEIQNSVIYQRMLFYDNQSNSMKLSLIISNYHNQDVIMSYTGFNMLHPKFLQSKKSIS